MLHRFLTIRYFSIMVIGFTLLVTSARSEMSINANATLASFNYDLDTIHLKLENLNATWQFSPFGNGKLLVEKMRAKRLIITLGDGTVKANDTGLPEHIKPPFPIKIQQAEINEVLVIKNGKTQIFNNVKFDLEADEKTIKLNSLNANTPWGNATTSLQINTIKPFALKGIASLKKIESTLPYDVKADLTGDLQTLKFNSTGVLTKIDGQLAILQTQQTGITPVAIVNIKGNIGLENNYPLSANIAINELNLEKIGNYPAAVLNFDVSVQGKILPSLITTIQFAARDSQWKNQVLVSNGKIFTEGGQITNLDLQANIANNMIKANGELGQNNKLNWQADLADLSQFGNDYSGQANVRGSATGTFENLALQFKLVAKNISLPSGLKVEKLEGQASIMSHEDGKVDGDFSAGNLQFGKYPMMDGKLTLQGTRAKHQLNLSAQGAEFKFTSMMHGGLIAATNRWQGMLQDFALDGKAPIKLTAPAFLLFDLKSATLEQASIQLNKSNVFIDHIEFNSNGFASKGHAEQLALEDLPSELFTLPSTLQGNPVFSGKWDIKISDSLDGSVSLRRENGDFTITIADGKKKLLGLSEAMLNAQFVNNKAEIRTSLKGQNFGFLDANINTTFTKVNSGFALLSNAPIVINAKAQLQTLAWMPMPTSLIDASLDGTINITLMANGTLAAPNLSGKVDGKNLEFFLPTEGVNFIKGELQASFEHHKLLITKAKWQGGDGHLEATGFLHLDNGKPQIDLDWTAENFTAITRADHLLTLSGTGKTTLAKNLLMISGNFTVAKGLIELSDEDTPVLGDDVVIIGQSDMTPEPALKVLLNGLHIDIGKEFNLRGRG